MSNKINPSLLNASTKLSHVDDDNSYVALYAFFALTTFAGIYASLSHVTSVQSVEFVCGCGMFVVGILGIIATRLSEKKREEERREELKKKVLPPTAIVVVPPMKEKEREPVQNEPKVVVVEREKQPTPLFIATPLLLYMRFKTLSSEPSQEKPKFLATPFFRRGMGSNNAKPISFGYRFKTPSSKLVTEQNSEVSQPLHVNNGPTFFSNK